MVYFYNTNFDVANSLLQYLQLKSFVSLGKNAKAIVSVLVDNISILLDDDSVIVLQSLAVSTFTTLITFISSTIYSFSNKLDFIRI
jgi:hypothetical protein